MKIERQTHDIEIYREDAIYEPLTVLDADGVAFDLTGYTLSASIKSHIDGPTILILNVAAVSAADGTVLVTSHTPETDLDFGTDGVGVWDLQIASSDATPYIYTAFAGAVTFVQDVTNP